MKNTMDQIIYNKDNRPHSAGVLVYRESKGRDNASYEFLILKSKWNARAWSPPKGHLDRYESVVNCAFRELLEETGFGEEQIVVQRGFKAHLVYDLPRPTAKVPDGKKRIVMLLCKLKDDAHDIHLSREHDYYTWVTMDTMRNYVDGTWPSCFEQANEFLQKETLQARLDMLCTTKKLK